MRPRSGDLGVSLHCDNAVASAGPLNRARQRRVRMGYCVCFLKCCSPWQPCSFCVATAGTILRSSLSWFYSFMASEQTWRGSANMPGCLWKYFLTVRELDDPDRVSNGCNTTHLEHRQADRSETDNSEMSLSLLKWLNHLILFIYLLYLPWIWIGLERLEKC